jgi:lipopolysaccharide transport protein LptA
MLKRFFINISIASAMFFTMAMCVPALAGETMVITSETLKADRGGNTAVFEGHVVARGGDMVLSAAIMTASYEEGGALSKLVAEGSVRLVKGLQVLTSFKAVYDLASRSMVFTGEPRAVDEGNVLMGDTIHYYLDEDRIKVEKSTMFIGATGSGTGGSHE